MGFLLAGGDTLHRERRSLCLTELASPLPDAAGVFVNHGGALLAAEGLLEFWHVGNSVVDAILGERVRISEDQGAESFWAHLVTPTVAVGEEEALAVGPAIFPFIVESLALLLKRDFQGLEGQTGAAVVGCVFALS